MAELINKNKMNKWTDGLLVGISKVATEKMLNPIIGNSNIISGVVKTFAGSMLASTKSLGKAGSIIGQGFQIDGIEDLALVLINQTNGLFGLLNSNNNTSTAETVELL
jgi:hypothetical protein